MSSAYIKIGCGCSGSWWRSGLTCNGWAGTRAQWVGTTSGREWSRGTPIWCSASSIRHTRRTFAVASRPDPPRSARCAAPAMPLAAVPQPVANQSTARNRCHFHDDRSRSRRIGTPHRQACHVSRQDTTPERRLPTTRDIHGHTFVPIRRAQLGAAGCRWGGGAAACSRKPSVDGTSTSLKTSPHPIK